MLISTTEIPPEGHTSFLAYIIQFQQLFKNNFVETKGDKTSSFMLKHLYIHSREGQ